MLHYCCEPCASFLVNFCNNLNFTCIYVLYDSLTYSTSGGHLSNLLIHGIQYVCMYVFQTHYFSENLVVSGIEPRPLNLYLCILYVDLVTWVLRWL
jgi:hypothetical protein